MERDAVISADFLYRYRLTRSWGPGKQVVFIMLNPSTATAEVDDPTIRRCVGFAKAWGFESLAVVNLFARRATDPGVLYEVEDPVGPENDQHLLEVCSKADLVVAAWGVHGAFRRRGDRVRDLLKLTTVHHLGLTKDGHPRHPLYLPKTLTPTAF